MKPEPSQAEPSQHGHTQPGHAQSATKKPSQITPRRLLLTVAAIYAAWLLWMAYVAWINVQAGNQ